MNRNIYLKYFKRPFDFILASVGLFFLSPLMLLICLVIFTNDGLPVFYQQKRVGQNGRLFEVLKFRTMIISSDSNTITVAGDPRVTQVGAFLRKYKLDELPQLWNVLKGEMSFVGPRPDVPGYMDKLEGEARVLLSLKPGITGPATLFFRNEEELLSKASDPKKYNDLIIFPKKVKINLEYINKAGLFYDMKIIIKTIL